MKNLILHFVLCFITIEIFSGVVAEETQLSKYEGRIRKNYNANPCTKLYEKRPSKNFKSYERCLKINGTLIPVTFRCPCGHYYDSKIQNCLSVQGGGEVVHVDYNGVCKDNYKGVLIHPTQKQFYYVCKNSGVLVVKCPKLQVFDVKKNYCIDVEDPTTITIYDESNGDIELPTCKGPGRYSIPDQPIYFYMCTMDGDKYYRSVFKCPPGSRYDPTYQSCTQMLDITTVTSTMGWYLENDPYPPCFSPGKFRSNKDCSLYYTCSAKQGGYFYQTRMSCPTGMYFCLKNMKCKNASEVECNLSDYEEPASFETINKTISTEELISSFTKEYVDKEKVTTVPSFHNISDGETIEAEDSTFSSAVNTTNTSISKDEDMEEVSTPEYVDNDQASTIASFTDTSEEETLEAEDSTLSSAVITTDTLGSKDEDKEEVSTPEYVDNDQASTIASFTDTSEEETLEVEDSTLSSAVITTDTLGSKDEDKEEVSTPEYVDNDQASTIASFTDTSDGETLEAEDSTLSSAVITTDTLGSKDEDKEEVSTPEYVEDDQATTIASFTDTSEGETLEAEDSTLSSAVITTDTLGSKDEDKEEVSTPEYVEDDQATTIASFTDTSEGETLEAEDSTLSSAVITTDTLGSKDEDKEEVSTPEYVEDDQATTIASFTDTSEGETLEAEDSTLSSAVITTDTLGSKDEDKEEVSTPEYVEDDQATTIASFTDTSEGETLEAEDSTLSSAVITTDTLGSKDEDKEEVSTPEYVENDQATTIASFTDISEEEILEAEDSTLLSTVNTTDTLGSKDEDKEEVSTPEYNNNDKTTSDFSNSDKTLHSNEDINSTFWKEDEITKSFDSDIVNLTSVETTTPYQDPDDECITLPSFSEYNFTCSEEGAFLYNNSCQIYYQCLWNDNDELVAEIMECPKCLRFNEKLGYCDLPQNVPRCYELYSNSDVSCSLEGIFPITGVCDQYKECILRENGEFLKIIKTCPEGLNFNNETRKCDNSISCPYQVIPKCEKEGIFQDTERCNEFYQCIKVNGTDDEFTSVRHKCPPSLVFNEKIGACDYARNVPGCGKLYL